MEGVDKEYQAPVNPVLAMLVSYVLPFVLIFLMFSLVMRWMAKKGGMGGMGGIGGVGKAQRQGVYGEVHRRHLQGCGRPGRGQVSLTEIIDFLHNPQKYTEIGAKLPRARCWSALRAPARRWLAKAVAGEANVPFFSISGSELRGDVRGRGRQPRPGPL